MHFIKAPPLLHINASSKLPSQCNIKYRYMMTGVHSTSKWPILKVSKFKFVKQNTSQSAILDFEQNRRAEDDDVPNTGRLNLNTY